MGPVKLIGLDRQFDSRHVKLVTILQSQQMNAVDAGRSPAVTRTDGYHGLLPELYSIPTHVRSSCPLPLRSVTASIPRRIAQLGKHLEQPRIRPQQRSLLDIRMLTALNR
jgi:hypothetical protein